MVRAGAVVHPEQWEHCGYNQIQTPSQRYRLLDLERLAQLCGSPSVAAFQAAHRRWVLEAVTQAQRREACWSEAIAVGGREFVERVQQQLRITATHRGVEQSGDSSVLREEVLPYGGHFGHEKHALTLDNRHFWSERILRSEG